MVLQAFVDDSSRDGESLILAGYLSSSEEWAQLSSSWAELLTIRPPWARLKMSEIMASGPSEENLERAIHHYRLVEKHVDMCFCVAVPRVPLQQAVADYNLPEWIGNPYYLAWKSIVSLVSEWLHKSGRGEQLDFVFDQQGEAGEIMRNWDRYFDKHSDEVRAMLKNKPSFRSDEECLPLQAADMLAWWVRRIFDQYGTIAVEVFPFPWGQTRPGPARFTINWRAEGVRNHVRSIRKGAMSQLNPVVCRLEHRFVISSTSN